MKTQTIIAASLAITALALTSSIRADVITDWNATAIRAIKAVNPNPLPASRALAMTHVAQFDAVNAVVRCYQPYAADLSAPGASPEAAAARAAYRVLTNFYPTQLALLDAALSASLVKCAGTVANRSAIGARIRVKATIGGETFWQLRELSTGESWTRTTPFVGRFGRGNATNVETVRIEWPSGTVQELRNVTANQFLTVTEPTRLNATKVSGQPQFTLKGGRNMTYRIEASANLRDWSPVTTATVPNLNGTVAITDPNAPSAHRFYRAVQP